MTNQSSHFAFGKRDLSVASYENEMKISRKTKKNTYILKNILRIFSVCFLYVWTLRGRQVGRSEIDAGLNGYYNYYHY